jgi:hypothetical protein
MFDKIIIAVAFAIIAMAFVIVATNAFAQYLQPPIGSYSRLPVGPANTTGGGAGPSPPPACSNKLDFSQSCNSQYMGMMQ